ncbi:related to 3-oxoacyl-[acyl-carrier-protein] reductase FabG [Armillaria ostoyae]|uniref:Related to 3-oxoacyl-[acyl-carrier-protein] reductase FabG n=1 Tax=Armillaria ostoyae TaxID=47428 RepID=A0A284QQ28_ARMOS|nr:related to 3-oxoacyl-[acyl-carrier-protein] reductase FabG [Armillaria ostoyae]
MTEGPVALVTGSARGMGRAIALRLASDGFNVALNDIASQKDNLEALRGEIEDLGKKAFIYIADVSKEDEVKAMVDETVEGLGRLDVMVANAGICPGVSGLMDTTAEQWDHIFAVNARGIFLCYKYAAMQMVKQGRGGRIIGACSVTGMRAQGHLCPYSASKFAVRGLTQSAAEELGSHQITVNAYAPGIIDTPMTGSVFPEESVRQSENIVALKKIGQPKDLASLVSYLASPESHFITGQTISVDGGWYFN